MANINRRLIEGNFAHAKIGSIRLIRTKKACYIKICGNAEAKLSVRNR